MTPEVTHDREPTGKAQKEIAESAIKKANLKLSGNVVTKSSLLKNYCAAEEYHQRYLEKR